VPSSGTCSKPCFGRFAEPGNAQQQSGPSLVGSPVCEAEFEGPLTGTVCVYTTGKRPEQHCHVVGTAHAWLQVKRTGHVHCAISQVVATAVHQDISPEIEPNSPTTQSYKTRTLRPSVQSELKHRLKLVLTDFLRVIFIGP
jgi:hypothetical protein